MKKFFARESTLAKKILRSLRHPSYPINHVKNVKDLYEAKIWFALNDLDGVVNELWHIIKLLPNIETHAHAVIAAKFYIVTWCTLSDVFAKLVNAVFNLGIDEKDINLMMTFRNEHVKKSDLLKIFNKYKTKIKHDEFKSPRNDIVHRGILRDPELERIGEMLSYIDLLQIFDTTETSKILEKIKSDLKNYLLQKQAEFKNHLEETLTMLNEMIEYMVIIFDKKSKLEKLKLENQLY